MTKKVFLKRQKKEREPYINLCTSRLGGAVNVKTKQNKISGSEKGNCFTASFVLAEICV